MLQTDEIIQNRYQLKQKLGDNTARQTWLATDLELPEKPFVVVKFLAFGGQIQWENLKLFEREAQILKQLDHPHIPKYRDYFCIDDRALWFALVEDYIPGTSLKELLAQKHKFTEKQIRKIAEDILNILAYLHQLNPPVLHRDIKPSNLILSKEEQVYLVDFGAVQDSAAKEGGTFTVVGTYGYTPIEQFGGRAVPASDLYALGATLIHLLTGIAPADLPQKDFRIHFSDKVSISSDFVHWLEKLIEPRLDKRFSTVKSALTDLKNSNSSVTNRSLLTKTSRNKKMMSPSSDRIDLKKSLDSLEIDIKPIISFEKIFNVDKFVFSDIFIYIANFMLTLPAILAAFSLLIILIVPILAPFISHTYIFVLITLYCIIIIKYLPPFFFGKTSIKFTSKKFEVKELVFGTAYSVNNGINLLIEDVSFQYDESTNQRNVTLTISNNKNTKFTRLSFGYTLNESELIWLAQEIREWLQLQKQQG